jgi:hypothetical protein
MFKFFKILIKKPLYYCALIASYEIGGYSIEKNLYSDKIETNKFYDFIIINYNFIKLNALLLTNFISEFIASFTTGINIFFYIIWMILISIILLIFLTILLKFYKMYNDYKKLSYKSDIKKILNHNISENIDYIDQQYALCLTIMEQKDLGNSFKRIMFYYLSLYKLIKNETIYNSLSANEKNVITLYNFITANNKLLLDLADRHNKNNYSNNEEKKIMIENLNKDLLKLNKLIKKEDYNQISKSMVIDELNDNNVIIIKEDQNIKV